MCPILKITQNLDFLFYLYLFILVGCTHHFGMVKFTDQKQKPLFGVVCTGGLGGNNYI